jgi:uroporphyrin-III C-methyltransferase/precorrin-2 dehydrogenase/sirohydrochlorin ferrochelatase
VIHAERPLAYMVALDLAGRRCVVLGGGEIAAQRVTGLLGAGAQVTVVADELVATLHAMAGRGDIAWTPRSYRAGDLRGAFLALNTSADLAIERRVREEAEADGVLLNTHDRPNACDFATPALVRRGRLQIAVSTSGDSPYVAAALRERLEHLIGEEWGPLLSLVGRVRRRLRRDRVPAVEQQRIYSRLMRPQVRALLRRQPGATEFAEMLRAEDVDASLPVGKVHLVGAGPGDPGLVTLAACELLLDADIVFHDALVSAETLRLCGARARLVDVGKRGGGSRRDQEEIIAMMIDAARSGLEVVRLKGGDPFLFGRGGEELDALRAAGIDTDVVPGITSALAAPAAADIPVTFRGVSGSVAVIAGQSSDGNIPESLERIARAVDTLVVLMPLGMLDDISARLATALGPDWPAAIIANATSSDEQVVRATVGDIAEKARHARITAPATLVIGAVVNRVRPPSDRAGAREAALETPVA